MAKRKTHFNKAQKRKMRKGFLWIHHEIMKDPDLNSSDKLVYMALAHFADSQTQECYPSRKTLEETTSLTGRTLSTSIDNLEKKGYIEVSRATGKVNWYQLNEPPKVGKPKSGKKPDVNLNSENNSTSEKEHQHPPKKDTTNNNNRTKTLSNESEEPDGSSSPDEFGSEKINNLLRFLLDRFDRKEFVDGQGWERRYAHLALRDFDRTTIVRTANWIVGEWTKSPVKMKTFYNACKEFKAKHPELYEGGAVLME